MNDCGETGRISGGKKERKNKREVKKNLIIGKKKIECTLCHFYINSKKHVPMQGVTAMNVFWK